MSGPSPAGRTATNSSTTLTFSNPEYSNNATSPVGSIELTELLEIFQTDELDLDTINEQLETVRAEIYARSKTN